MYNKTTTRDFLFGKVDLFLHALQTSVIILDNSISKKDQALLDIMQYQWLCDKIDSIKCCLKT
jgi:hypothetical protein